MLTVGVDKGAAAVSRCRGWNGENQKKNAVDLAPDTWWRSRSSVTNNNDDNNGDAGNGGGRCG